MHTWRPFYGSLWDCWPADTCLSLCPCSRCCRRRVDKPNGWSEAFPGRVRSIAVSAVPSQLGLAISCMPQALRLIGMEDAVDELSELKQREKTQTNKGTQPMLADAVETSDDELADWEEYDGFLSTLVLLVPSTAAHALLSVSALGMVCGWTHHERHLPSVAS